MTRKRSTIRLDALPGHLIRRLQQIAVAAFMDEVADVDVTPVQFALLHAAAGEPGLDQRTLAARIAFDTSTIAAVVDRLERRGLIRRGASPLDRRVRLLTVTRAGEALLDRASPAMRRAQRRIVAPLPVAERARFVAMMRTVVDAHGAADDPD